MNQSERIAVESLDRIRELEREREEDRAAIRALWERVIGRHTSRCLTADGGCGLYKHAAAIARATGQEGAQ